MHLRLFCRLTFQKLNWCATSTFQKLNRCATRMYSNKCSLLLQCILFTGKTSMPTTLVPACRAQFPLLICPKNGDCKNRTHDLIYAKDTLYPWAKSPVNVWMFRNYHSEVTQVFQFQNYSKGHCNVENRSMNIQYNYRSILDAFDQLWLTLNNFEWLWIIRTKTQQALARSLKFTYLTRSS